jgi:ubiquinol-cytochrome c reductase cytochrome b subunit
MGGIWTYIRLQCIYPALVPLGIVLTGAALWPFLEQWITGDRREHHVNDRPRNAPTRTALGMAMISFYGVLWLEGSNDVLADHFSVPLYTITEIARVTVFLVRLKRAQLAAPAIP